MDNYPPGVTADMIDRLTDDPADYEFELYRDNAADAAYDDRIVEEGE